MEVEEQHKQEEKEFDKILDNFTSTPKPLP